MTSTKFSISGANRLTGKSRTTILKDIKEGILACDVDKNGKKLIDQSELRRVYGDDNWNLETENSFSRKPKEEQRKNKKNGRPESDEIEFLRQQLLDEKRDRAAEREILAGQIETLKGALSKAQEGQNAVTRLLDHQSKEKPEWVDTLKTMGERISNQDKEKAAGQRRRRKLVDHNKNLNRARKQLQAELEDEKSKPIWKKLLG